MDGWMDGWMDGNEASISEEEVTVTVCTFSGSTEMQWLARTQMALHNNLITKKQTRKVHFEFIQGKQETEQTAAFPLSLPLSMFLPPTLSLPPSLCLSLSCKNTKQTISDKPSLVL